MSTWIAVVVALIFMPQIAEAQVLDADQDGVIDSLDRCPAEPETLNGFEDDDGCRDRRLRLPRGLRQVSRGCRQNMWEVRATSFQPESTAAARLAESIRYLGRRTIALYARRPQYLNNPVLHIDAPPSVPEAWIHELLQALGLPRSAYRLEHNPGGVILFALVDAGAMC